MPANLVKTETKNLYASLREELQVPIETDARNSENEMKRADHDICLT